MKCWELKYASHFALLYCENEFSQSRNRTANLTGKKQMEKGKTFKDVRTNLFEKRVAPFRECLLLDVDAFLLQYLYPFLLVLGGTVFDTLVGIR